MSEEIETQAAEWAAKLAAGDLGPDDVSRLEAWRNADIRHVGALVRAHAILVRLDRLRAVGVDGMSAAVATIQAAKAGVAADGPCTSASDPSGRSAEGYTVKAGPGAFASPAIATGALNWTRRRIVLVGSTAASVAALASIGVQYLGSRSEFTTQIGETRRIGLSDGSAVTLNTNTRMAVDYTKSARSIELEQGEALFKVAKNKDRPFIVKAGNTQVRAVGTSFTVRLLPQRPVEVMVQEGVVEVIRRDVPSPRPVRAAAETHALVPVHEPIVLRAVPGPEVARNLAWQFGKLAFENETLANAAEEFARYSSMRIVVDPAVAKSTITGRFASNDPVGFARGVASVLNLRVEIKSDEVRITR